MMNLIFLLIIMIIITSFMILMNIFLSMNNKMNREKNNPFECGFNMNSNSRLPFTNHFFLITLLFLIFDIEIMMILPSTFLLNSFNLINLTLILMFFLMILMISLIYEWIIGMLNWIF